MAAKKKIKIEEIVKETVVDLLEKLEITAEVTVDGSEEEGFLVNVKTEETGLLIGYHGEVINSFQLILGVILYKKLSKWVRVVMDVGDYRKTREESIKQMVARIVQEVETTGQEVSLPYLTPFERRIVHVLVSDNPKVASQSQGEGRDRRVTIKPRETVSS